LVAVTLSRKRTYSQQNAGRRKGLKAVGQPENAATNAATILTQ
jgi:hypothetical protein